MSGAWQGSRWCTNIEVSGMTQRPMGNTGIEQLVREPVGHPLPLPSPPCTLPPSNLSLWSPNVPSSFPKHDLTCSRTTIGMHWSYSPLCKGTPLCSASRWLKITTNKQTKNKQNKTKQNTQKSNNKKKKKKTHWYSSTGIMSHVLVLEESTLLIFKAIKKKKKKKAPFLTCLESVADFVFCNLI